MERGNGSAAIGGHRDPTSPFFAQGDSPGAEPARVVSVSSEIFRQGGAAQHMLVSPVGSCNRLLRAAAKFKEMS
jgi:hypothetical protein